MKLKLLHLMRTHKDQADRRMVRAFNDYLHPIYFFPSFQRNLWFCYQLRVGDTSTQLDSDVQNDQCAEGAKASGNKGPLTVGACQTHHMQCLDTIGK